MSATVNEDGLARAVGMAAKGVLDGARANFERDGECAPVAFVLARKVPPGVNLPKLSDEVPFHLMMVPVLGPLADPNIGKDLLARVLRDVARTADAVAVLFVSEAWMLKAGPGLDPAEALTAGHGGRVHEHPKRIEVLTVFMEAESGDKSWSAEIRREPGKRPTLSEWRSVGTPASGRFVGLLPGRTPGRGNDPKSFM